MSGAAVWKSDSDGRRPADTCVASKNPTQFIFFTSPFNSLRLATRFSIEGDIFLRFFWWKILSRQSFHWRQSVCHSIFPGSERLQRSSATSITHACELWDSFQNAEVIKLPIRLTSDTGKETSSRLVRIKIEIARSHVSWREWRLSPRVQCCQLPARFQACSKYVNISLLSVGLARGNESPSTRVALSTYPSSNSIIHRYWSLICGG